MIDLLFAALGDIFTIKNLLLMMLGVTIGISVGILPGLGGTVGMSLVIPFIFDLRSEPESAIALMIGMAAVIHTADTFPSVLLGVPGSAGSQATIMDGYPMAKNGEATRALSAAFFSSMVGGVIGAFTLLMILPLARPIVLAFGPAELFMLAVLGLSIVAILAGKRPLRGLMAGGLGMLIGSIGSAPNESGVFRFDYGQPYLWDGIPLAVLALGLFALPEILDLLASGTSIAGEGADTRSSKGQAFRGLRDVAANKLLVLRSSVIGVVVGFIPGLGGSVVDWISYGFARQSVKDPEGFGRGDVRGVIAPESSNNAKEGGALIPTLLFSIPGSGTTAVLLSAFIILGIQPGRSMLEEDKQLSITVFIIATLAIANIFGTLACLSATGVVTKLANVRAARLAPFVLVVMLVGAYQSTKNWGDFIAFAVIGLLGWTMRKTDYPLPPLLIGYVLARSVERNLWLSLGVYDGWGFLTEPGAIVIGLITVALAIGGLRANKKTNEAAEQMRAELEGRPVPGESDGDAANVPVERGSMSALMFSIFIFFLFLYAGVESLGFAGRAQQYPRTVAFAAALIAGAEVLSYGRIALAGRRAGVSTAHPATPDPVLTGLRSIARYLLWLAGLYLAISLIGLVLAAVLFVIVFLAVEGELVWWRAVLAGIGVFVFLVSMEDIMSLRWPDSTFELIPSQLEDWLPEKIPGLNRLA